ncbi:cation transporter [Cecembia calidifontis]|uniref:Cation efflux family protein n=1 Tax=Cecembia calidifontis TaxID=1187080 RepID=A0A4Q7PC11_9BACT|nr:cation transporter [Cecembia calidifontis]RZS97755.1 cation efflux family protein [Cecembia calidifontis]
MQKSTFRIEKMDCPSEEQLIRMKIGGLPAVHQLVFDIPGRKLEVFHTGQIETISKELDKLSLQSFLIKTEEVKKIIPSERETEKKVLWTVLIINFLFFVVEMATGIISKSMGLVADSLDMLADAVVYGLALLAVERSLTTKRSVAKVAGTAQILLAVIGFTEVIRRFFGFEALPDFKMMIGVSFLALLANAVCLYLLQKSKSREAHMKASMIFTSNDIIINAGVICAGLVVLWTGSVIPDLIIGGIVFLIVLNGAIRILKL